MVDGPTILRTGAVGEEIGARSEWGPGETMGSNRRSYNAGQRPAHLDEEVCLIRSFFWLFILLILVACTSSVPTTESPSSLPTATPSTSPAIIVEPTSTIDPTITPPSPVAVAATPTPMLAVTYRGALVGRDANGAFTLGDPAAPLTLIDYSDFL